MCMDSDLPKQDAEIFSIIQEIISENPTIPFKNQQRDENDLTNQEKLDIAKDIYQKSKLVFFTRFGKFFNQQQLNSVNDIFKNSSELEEINLIIANLRITKDKPKSIKNRRYEALKRLITENSYFSETEMMKRNPLLYEHLIGQYLTQTEIRERDRVNTVAVSSFVSILLDGIERQQSEIVKLSQVELEDNAMEEEDSSDEEKIEITSKLPVQNYDATLEDQSSQEAVSKKLWGEFDFEASSSKTTDISTHFQRREQQTISHKPNTTVTENERRLLRDEFISIMHESFLSGKDDYDYDTIDNDDQYDDMEMIGHDEEDRYYWYFDSEEPEELMTVETGDDSNDSNDSSGFIERKKKVESSSEDELDMFMSALNNHPTVCKLTIDMKNLGK